MFLTYFSKGGGFYRVDGEREFGFEGDLRLAMWRLLFTFAEDRVRFVIIILTGGVSRHKR